MSPKDKGGRRGRIFRDPRTGEPVPNLGFHKGRKKFYIRSARPKWVYLSEDLCESVDQLAEWERQQRGEPLADVELSPIVTADVIRRYAKSKADDATRMMLDLLGWSDYELDETFAEKLDVPDEVVYEPDGTIFAQDGLFRWDDEKKAFVFDPPLDGRWFWRNLGELIRENPRRVADLTALPELGNLAYLANVKRPNLPPLSKLGMVYNEQSKANARWKKDVVKYWNEFVEMVGSSSVVGNVRLEDVRRYGNAIEREREERDLSPSYVKARFDSVRTVLRSAKKQGFASPQLDELIGHCLVLDSPSHNGNDPKPIDRKHYQALLKSADVKWQAILLLSLNCGLYPSELASVRRTEIDLKKKTFIARRSKTKLPRVAVLWARTVKAIRAYQKDYPHQSEWLIVNRAGNRFQPHKLSEGFRTVRKRAEVPDVVEFAHIRDGAATASDTAGNLRGFDDRQTDLLLGHRAHGVRDAYALRHPELVKDACSAIEKAYFGRKTK